MKNKCELSVSKRRRHSKRFGFQKKCAAVDDISEFVGDEIFKRLRVDEIEDEEVVEALKMELVMTRDVSSLKAQNVQKVKMRTKY